MSLPLLDRLSLIIHPSGITLERAPWRGQTEQFTKAPDPTGNNEAAWQSALAATTTLLDLHSRPHSRLEIIIANQFVRYALLPWSSEVLGDKARLAMARAIFLNSYANQAEQLELTLDRSAFGMNGLAAGIHCGLLDGLRHIAKTRKLRLASIRPRLVSDLAINARSIDDGCIAFPDKGWLTLVGLRSGNLCLLRNHRMESSRESFTSELQSILAIESHSIRMKTVHIFSRATWPKAIGEWRVDCRKPLSKDWADA